MNKPQKWTEDRVAQLNQNLSGTQPVPLSEVENIATILETTQKSVASKLRSMGLEVEKVIPVKTGMDEDVASAIVELITDNPGKYTYVDLAEKFAPLTAKQIQGKMLFLRMTDKVASPPKPEPTFSAEATAELEDFVTTNSGKYTYAEIASVFRGASYTPRQVQGKLLAMELTKHIKPTDKAVATKTYTEEEEATVVSMIQEGKHIEDIAEAVGKELNSVRGKALALIRKGDITNMPRQRESYANRKVDVLDGVNVAEMTVAQIAEVILRTESSVKSLLTRRSLTCADYDGAAKQAKLQAKREEVLAA